MLAFREKHHAHLGFWPAHPRPDPGCPRDLRSKTVEVMGCPRTYARLYSSSGVAVS
jgi:hypothetical protein